MSDEQKPAHPQGPATLAIHGGEEEKHPGKPVVQPIVQSATFHWATPDDGELLYSRYGNNPNQLMVGRKIAALEGTEAAVALGSGMGATAMTFLALVEAGDHDSIFPLRAVKKAVRRAGEVYSVFGAAGEVEVDYFEGRHQISGRRAYDFLWEKLRPGAPA